MVNVPLPTIGATELAISVGGEFFVVPKQALAAYRVVDPNKLNSLRTLSTQIQAGAVASAAKFRGDWVAGVRG